MKKYLINISLTFLFLLISSLLINILYYFDLINNTLYKTIIIIINSLIIGIFSFKIGKKTENKGYLEGLKFGIIISIIMFLIETIIFKNISLYMIIYYLIIITISTVGAMLGINKKKS